MRQRIVAVLIVLFTMAPLPARAESGTGVLKASGVKGGLVVQVGCSRGWAELLAELSDGQGSSAKLKTSYLLHGLDSDPKNVATARKCVRSDMYGQVSVERFDGPRLPYVDNLVNLIVVSDDKSGVSSDEILRVLAPNGVALLSKGLKSPDRWTKIVKPRPTNIGEWTHFLHGPDGNAVSGDTVVGPPKHLQWIAKPIWSRHHDVVPVISALVSANGRMFYIVNEAPGGVGGETQGKWFLAARDAFNGVLLWKRPMKWGWKQWSLIWKARFNQPNHIPKRLVAVGDRVYVTLGFNAPLTVLDAATGRTIKTYEGTEFTDEILCVEDTLILSVNQAAQKPGTIAEAPPIRKSILALNGRSGKTLWKTGSYVGTSSKTGSVERVTHLLLAARGKRVLLADSNAIVGLDLKTGKELWKAPRPTNKRYTSRYEHLMSDLCTLVAADEVVLFAQLTPVQKRIGHGIIKAGIAAFSADTGKPLWSRVIANWGHFCAPDVFVAQGRVWVHDYKSPAMVGLDPLTGEVQNTLSTGEWFKQGHHHRCYRNKATEKFILTGYRGIEFLDMKSGTVKPTHWTRGECRFGIVPCNGLIYVTPHPCACYVKALLRGLLALGPKRPGEPALKADAKEYEALLVKGPAFGKKSESPGNQTDQWPTYRRNALRSGSTKTPVPTGLKCAWKAKIAGRLSAPVITDGKVFVASIDANTLYALDRSDGRTAWTFTAGGRIDSPPTVHKGLVMFGCGDGWVYCLDASDGRLAWRLRAAPTNQRMVAFGRLESPWPVSGSVLVKDGPSGQGVAYFAAGRSSYLDGGIYVYSVDPKTGKVLSRKCIYSPDPKTDQQPPQDESRHMPGVLSDILVSDGRGVFMRQMRVDLAEATEPKDRRHVLSTSGFLDDTFFNRMTWSLGPVSHSQFLVFDETTICGFEAYKNSRRWEFFFPETEGYTLFAFDRTPAENSKAWKDTEVVNGKKQIRDANPPAHRWRVKVPIRAMAMVLTGPLAKSGASPWAGQTLFLAGAPDVIGGDDPWAAMEGRSSAALWAVSVAGGKKLAEYKLDSPPVFNGMAAADKKLYISLQNGVVECHAASK